MNVAHSTAAGKPKNATIHSNPIRLLMGVPPLFEVLAHNGASGSNAPVVNPPLSIKTLTPSIQGRGPGRRLGGLGQLRGGEAAQTMCNFAHPLPAGRSFVCWRALLFPAPIGN
jgi:hypothetical protein